MVKGTSSVANLLQTHLVCKNAASNPTPGERLYSSPAFNIITVHMTFTLTFAELQAAKLQG